MGSPYIGEIRLFAGTYAPESWRLCDGSLVNISEYDTLFMLLGTTFGGDGQTTFGLPDLRSRVPLHAGQGRPTFYAQGMSGGVEKVTLSALTNGYHSHPVTACGDAATISTPSSLALLATQNGGVGQGVQIYAPPGAQLGMAPQSITPVGQSAAHENRQPFLAVTYIISMFGIYPTPPADAASPA